MKNVNRKKRSGKGETCKPPKPYPSFPLTPHNGGKWLKRIRGKIHCFGRWGKIVDGVMDTAVPVVSAIQYLPAEQS